MLFDPTPAITDATALSLLGHALTAAFAAAVAGGSTWLFTRRKTESDVNVNESEVIQTLVNTIAGLQKDIDSFIEKTKALRVEVETVEAAKRDADRLIEQVKSENLDKNRALRQLYIEEKAKLAESVLTMIMIVEAINSGLEHCPNCGSLIREGIRLSELLHYVRGRLLQKTFTVK